MTTTKTSLQPFDVTECLDTQEKIDSFLQEVSRSDDPAVVAAGIEDAARAQKQLNRHRRQSSPSQTFTIHISGSVSDLLPALDHYGSRATLVTEGHSA